MAAMLTLASTLAAEATAIDGAPDRCRSIELVDRDGGTILRGAEDIVVDPARSTAYVSIYDRWGVEDAAATGTPLPQGGIYALPLSPADRLEGRVPVIDLTREFKTGRTFHPHGIALLDGAEGRPPTLFAVNKQLSLEPGGAVRPNPVIEVFGLADGALHHRQTVQDPAICHPNDIAPLDPRGFLVTNDHGNCTGPAFWLEWAFGMPWSNVVRVELGTASPNDHHAVRMADGIAFANGVAVSEGEPPTLVVAGTRDRALHLFELGSETVVSARTHHRRVPVDGAPDNISRDENGWLVAVHPSLLRLARRLHRWFEPVPVPSRVVALSDDFTRQHIIFEDKDGTYISGATVAVRHRGLLLIGSASDHRLAVCGTIRPESENPS
jgi:hypothetical protein